VKTEISELGSSHVQLGNWDPNLSLYQSYVCISLSNSKIASYNFYNFSKPGRRFKNI